MFWKRNKKKELAKGEKKRALSKCQDTKLKGTNRDGLAKIPRTEKQAVGLRNDVAIHSWEKSRWAKEEPRAAGGGGRSWVRNCK